MKRLKETDFQEEIEAAKARNHAPQQETGKEEASPAEALATDIEMPATNIIESEVKTLPDNLSSTETDTHTAPLNH